MILIELPLEVVVREGEPSVRIKKALALLLAILILHVPAWCDQPFSKISHWTIYDATFRKPGIEVGGEAPGSQSSRPGPVQISAELRQKTLDVVWRTVKEAFFDPTLGGIDWDKVRDRYQPRILSAPDDREFYRLLNEMLGLLKVSHLKVFTLEENNEPSSMAAAGGIDLRVIDGAATITRVDPQSPAAGAGLRPGFVINHVDDVATAALFDRVTADRPTLRGSELRNSVLRLMHGQPGTAFRIKYLNADNSEREVTLKRGAPVKGGVGGELSYYIDVETKTLDRGIGYLRFDEFNPRLTNTLVSFVQSMRDAPGIIMDMRGNHGGDDSVGWRLAAHLLGKPTLFYLVRTRKGLQEQRIKPAAKPYNGRVAILLDGLSLSAAEQFAAAMQELGRATIIGENTPGVDLDANIKKLPTGAYLLYAEGEPRTPKGVVIEGRGVVPDIRVSLTRQALLEGVDAQLEAAIEWINMPAR